MLCVTNLDSIINRYAKNGSNRTHIENSGVQYEIPIPTNIIINNSTNLSTTKYIDRRVKMNAKNVFLSVFKALTSLVNNVSIICMLLLKKAFNPF